METNSKLSSLMDQTLRRMKEIIDVDTVVGSPITTPDGITIIPVSKVSYAFAGAGSDLRGKNKEKEKDKEKEKEKEQAQIQVQGQGKGQAQRENGFAGGNGAGVRIEPVGFLVVKDANVRMISITPPASTTVDRMIEKAPELMETVDNFLRSRTKTGSAE